MIPALLASIVTGYSCFFGSYCEPEDLKYLMMEQALFSCPNVSDYSKVDESILETIWQAEERYDVPYNLKGMALAAACYESGFNTRAKGDHKFSAFNKPKAIGLFQMWPWWTNKKYGYGVERSNPRQAAEAWMAHISKMIPKVKKSCKFKSKERIWIAAWVRAIRKPKKIGTRCNERPKHLRLLKAWHRNIARDCKIPGC